MRSALSVVAAAFVGLVASPAKAQDAPPFDPAVDVQLFEYAVGPKEFFTVPNAEIATHMGFQVDMMLTFLTKPLVVFSFDEVNGELEEERTDVVESILAGQVGGAIGYKDRFQFGVAIPLIFSMTGQGLDPATGNMDPGGLQATGLGDIRAEAKMRFTRRSALAASGLVQISLPTSVGSGGGMFLGDNTPSARLAGVAQWTSASRRATLGATAGLLLRKPREIYETNIGQQLTYGAAATLQIHRRVDLTAETFGRVGFDFSGESTPLEAIAGGKLRATDAIAVSIGGGAGLLKGVGSPALRMFLSVGYAPDFRDTDGDGIANNKDRCPLIEEDRDGFDDADGCPDQDNDGDRRDDSEDKCPLVPEDLDGFQDDDGCPELDNDKDGLADLDDRCPDQAEDGIGPGPRDGCPATVTDTDDDGVYDATDKCPNEAEDADGYLDDDGCPDPDNDGDGILDEDDLCGLCAEDKDGFSDEDGCPDLDNDADGILDADDQCPLEPETINGNNDSDGCPDSGRSLASFDGEKIALGQAIKFTRSNQLRKGKLLDQLVAVMRAAPVTKWRIVIVAAKQSDPEAHKAKSQAQADALKEHLAGAGVSAEIEAVGVAADRVLTAIVSLEKKGTSPEDSCTE